MLTQAERILAATKTIESLLVARKAVHMYPENNQIVDNAINQFFQDIQNLLACQDTIEFEITRNSISFEMEDIFSALQNEAGLVFMLYRDGIRKISFKKGLTREEALRFVAVLTGDSGRESAGYDMVSAIWEQDFRHIRLKVYDPEIFAESRIKNTLQPGDFNYADLSAELKRIYNDAAEMTDEGFQMPDIIELTDEELLTLRSDTDSNLYDRTGKTLAISFELFLLPGPKDYERLEENMKRAIEYALDNRKLDVLVDFFLHVKTAYIISVSDSDFRRSLLNIFSFFSSEKFFTRLGSMLDEGTRLEQDTFDKLTKLLADRSVPILVKLLGYLDTISARKTVINLLVAVGSRNMPALYEALSDEKWYVVRNVVIALRQIGDKQAKQYLLEMLEHRDNRVRREAIKAIAELGGNEAVDLVSGAMDDPDDTVRHFALGSLGNFDSAVAKRLLVEKIRAKRFLSLPYNEKKEYYVALLRYEGEDVVQLLAGMLCRKTFFGKAANDENRAVIAYCVGNSGKRAFLPALQSIDQTGSELLRNNVREAIRKIKDGH